jgi:hypothetical protein
MVSPVRIEDRLSLSRCLLAEGQLRPSVLVQTARKEVEPTHGNIRVAEFRQSLNEPDWLTDTHSQERQNIFLKGLYSTNAYATRLRLLDNAVLVPKDESLLSLLKEGARSVARNESQVIAPTFAIFIALIGAPASHGVPTSL